MVKNVYGIGACLLTLGLTVTSGYATTINDDYIGGIYYSSTNTVYSYSQDVVNDDDRYAIDRMEVDLTSDLLTVSIFTNYAANVEITNPTTGLGDGIDLGDLFLSNNGYTPNSLTTEDYLGNGEFWEYGLVLDNHNGSTSSGIATLYQATSAADYIFAENTGTNVFRRGQEVLLNTSNKQAVGTGTWELFSDHITFTIDPALLSLGVEDLGIRWSMTCANDIIEGSVPSNAVPEPATMFLFGTGLAGLAGFSRRRKK